MSMWWVLLGLGTGALPDVVVVPAGLVDAGCDPAQHGTCLGARVEELRVDRTPVPNGALAACRAAGVCVPWVPADLGPTDCALDTPGAEAPVSMLQAWATADWAEASAYCGWRGGRLATEAEWERARVVAPDTVYAGTEWVEGWFVVGGGGGGPLMGGFQPRTRLVVTPGQTPSGDVRSSAGMSAGVRNGWRCAYNAQGAGSPVVLPNAQPCPEVASPAAGR